MLSNQTTRQIRSTEHPPNQIQIHLPTLIGGLISPANTLANWIYSRSS